MTLGPQKALAALLVLAGLLAATPALADDGTEIERGRTSYEAGRFQEGAERLRAMLDPESPVALHDPALIERARAYYAACLVALGRLDEADAQFEAILRANRAYRLDPVIFPGSVVDRFTDVRARLEPELERRDAAERAAREKARAAQDAYVGALEKLAGEETLVVRRSRWIALVPFGAGQFQNGQTALGWTLLGVETALAGASLWAGIDWQSLVSKYDQRVDVAALNDKLATRQRESLWLGGAFAAVALGGILHAELTFVPEVKETRRRPLPPRPALTPTAAALPGGAVVGLGGSF